MKRIPPSFGLCLAMLTLLLAGHLHLGAQTLPPGFRDSVIFSGLVQPTAVAFSPDGRVFVAEKRGLVRVFSSLSDTTPTVFANLLTNVHNYWDRGLLGLALHPSFPSVPYVYVLYAHDAEIGGTAPRWGVPNANSDPCPSPPGGAAHGCVISGRLSRLEASGDVMIGTEQVLIEDWFQQYPSHSIGSLFFGADGALYASGGDGASFTFVDYGQKGIPLNPGGDPPVPVGGTQTPPTAEGGALRPQDLRTSGDPVTLDGAVIRINPTTGAGLPDNPLAGSPDPNARRIIAYGLRNPFRMTMRPGTSQIWMGDVGWEDWEEINRIGNVSDSVVENFGFPCYEGLGRQPSYDSANLNICENLYGEAGAVTPPFYTYEHHTKIVPGEPCSTGSSSISGIAFYAGNAYPALYHDALFFADYSRQCIWAMPPGAGGDPDPSQRQTFISGAGTPVQLIAGPGDDLFYVDIEGGKIHRIQYSVPTAVIAANPTSGNAPLEVQFDATGSTHPVPGEPLTYSWDLNGDGTFGDSTAAQPTWTYTQSGSFTVRLRVTDSGGGTDTAQIGINVGNTPPVASIASPSPSLTWKVGDNIAFSGSATDAQDGSLPASALSWSLILHHCPEDCHTHAIQSFDGVASGSFAAEDHDYPSYLEILLTATDSGGLQGTKSVLVYPKTVPVTFQSNPPGLQLVVGSTTATAPFSDTVIVGSTNSISAPSPQNRSGQTYTFESWSDGGAQSHNITAPATATTYTATYAASGVLVSGVAPDSGPSSGGTEVDITGSNFQPGASVTFSGVSATSVTVTSPTEITACTPSLPAGALQDVVVTNTDSSTGLLPNAFLGDFLDVPATHPFHNYVEKIFRNSVTVGCGGGNFCPASPVTRAQMAVFLLKAKHGPSYVPPAATGTVFGDVPATAFAAEWIEQLAAEGITAGCGGGNYCPDAPVTRAQMAVFLLRSKHGSTFAPPQATGDFDDVPISSPYARWIEQLFAEGITAGCGGGNYCPNDPNTRGQMAVFLTKTFELP